MIILRSILTVSGPLSARNPCSCLRRLNRGNPTRRQFTPRFRWALYWPHLEAAWPMSMIAYLAAFWESSPFQGAMICLTRFQRGRRVLSESHSPTSKPALNLPNAQL